MTKPSVPHPSRRLLRDGWETTEASWASIRRVAIAAGQKGKIEKTLPSEAQCCQPRGNGAGTVVACYSSMQLTRAADYGVRAIVHLATLPEHSRALLPVLAHATGADANNWGTLFHPAP